MVWSTCYGNKVTLRSPQDRAFGRAGHDHLDAPPTESVSCHWSAPLAIDPFDHNNVYYGCNVIFHTNSAGQSWRVIGTICRRRSRSHHAVGRHRRRPRAVAPEVIFAIATSEWKGARGPG
jgi:hypothetical protein